MRALPGDESRRKTRMPRRRRGSGVDVMRAPLSALAEPLLRLAGGVGLRELADQFFERAARRDVVA